MCVVPNLQVAEFFFNFIASYTIIGLVYLYVCCRFLGCFKKIIVRYSWMGVVWLRIVYVRRRLDIQSYHMHLNHLCRWVRLLLDRSLDPPRLLCLLFRVIMWVIIIHLGGWVCVKHPQRSCHSSGWQSLLSSSKDARHYHCSWQTSSTTCNPANSRRRSDIHRVVV